MASQFIERITSHLADTGIQTKDVAHTNIFELKRKQQGCFPLLYREEQNWGKSLVQRRIVVRHTVCPTFLKEASPSVPFATRDRTRKLFICNPKLKHRKAHF